MTKMIMTTVVILMLAIGYSFAVKSALGPASEIANILAPTSASGE